MAVLVGFGCLAATAQSTPPVPPPLPTVIPPTVDPLAESHADEPFPDTSPARVFVAPEVAAALPDAAPPAVYFKKTSVRYTALAGQEDDYGSDSLDIDTAIAFRDLPQFTVGPGGGVMFLDGPGVTDLPPRLYTGQVEFRWFSPVTQRLAYEVAATPSVYTDGENTSGDAFRMMGRGLVFLFLSPQTQLVAGAVYLDRKDVPALPVLGVIHKPSDDLALELVFPRPRILKRIGDDPCGTTWAYLGGELGGGSWAIRRADGRDDVVTLRDYRLLLGLERRRASGWTANVELGYAFGRRVEYESNDGDFNPDGTFLLRVAVAR